MRQWLEKERQNVLTEQRKNIENVSTFREEIKTAEATRSYEKAQLQVRGCFLSLIICVVLLNSYLC